jgi:predicted esterase
MEEWSCRDGRLLRSERHPFDSTCHPRFDLFSFEFTGPEDETGVLRSKNEVDKLIAQEVDAGLPANRIVIGGFSQGGAITLATGLTTPRQLAGLTVLSGWFPIRDKIKGVCRGGLFS